MSNNGINSATNGRASANSTHAHTATHTIATHPVAVKNRNLIGGASNINSGSGGVGGVGGASSAKTTSINLKTNESRTKINNVAVTAATTTTAPTTTTTNSTLPDSKPLNMAMKANNNDQHTHHQQQQQYVNIKKSSGHVAFNSNSLNSSSQVASQQQQQQQHHQPLVNVNKLPTHRRDSSNVSGHHAHTGILPQSLKDASKYRYLRPQTHYRAEDNSRDEVDRVVDRRLSGGMPITTATAVTAYEDDPKKEKNDMLLVYYDGQLEGGSLDALIEHMVPTHDYYPDRIYTFAFLLSARLFIRPHELLAKISQTWERQQHQQQQQQQQQSGTVGPIQDHLEHDAGHFSSNITNSPLAQRKPMAVGVGVGPPTNTQKSAHNCIRLLAEWIETFPYDFRDERLMQQVRILTRKCVYIDNSLGKQVSKILQLLVQRLTSLEKYEEFLQSLQQYDLNNTLQPHYSTSASASYSSTSSTSASSTNATHINSLTKSSVQALNSHHHHHHHDSSHKNNYLSNAQYSTHATAYHHNSIVPANSSSSSAASSTTGVGSDSPNAHDVYGIMDLCPSCAQLAHQLTAIELDRLSHIGPEEFVQAFAKEYQNSMANSASNTAGGVMSTSLNDMKKTRNLESYVEWFNRLSYLTASEIVKYPKKKQRVRVIEYWIETARECFNIGNFNSLMAIIAGLNLAPISRLKKTWSKVQSAKFSVLEHQMDPTSNFNSYRSTLKAAMWRSEGATEERERIIIPFFSLFVKDLYFLNEGCSNRLPNNHINFEKCSQLAKQVMEFNEWKQVTCPFEQSPNVIAYLQNISVLNENTLSMASFECETPENTEEKDRYKTVKAETKQLLQQLQEQQLHQQQQLQQQQQQQTQH
ncbi:ras guanine nucleotide exchange factor M [Stomoxys calcitrans]|uniref:ras guanine nucleotide exchange factor M n=1 Tax=Stomoxys calcitrans TaxID=35570 RepID=UPI0027E304E5|nr:ras guanine nucleotide exchange factor M [Stomoxys calcitrans]